CAREDPMTVIEDQARSIFLAALERGPDQWPALLDVACGGNLALRARVDQLLHAHRAMGSIHGWGKAALGATGGEPLRERPGTAIARSGWRGRTGGGARARVFVAKQHHPARGKSAPKVTKPGMDGRKVVAGFEAERQALALRAPPNIAASSTAAPPRRGGPI